MTTMQSASDNPRNDSWRAAWANPRLRVAAPITVISFAAALVALARFLAWVESERPGVVLPDPILAQFHPVDYSVITFGVIYLCFVVYVVAHRSHPRMLLILLQSYTLMILFRICFIYVVPLAAPVTTIPLVDSLVETFGPSQRLTKDLFFSGHTSILALLAFASRNRWLRIFFGLAALTVAASVMAQHVHYAADVIVVPFVAWGAYSIIRYTWGERRRTASLDR